MKIAILIPAYNEEERIRETIRATKKISVVDEIIVIDDGSTDSTARIVEDEGVRLVQNPKNVGKGQALNLGFSSTKADIFLLLDADLEASAVNAEKLLVPLMNNEADMVIGNLNATQAKMGFGLAKNIAKLGIYLLTGKVFECPLSGQRALRRSVIESIGGFADAFGVEVALTVRAIKQGFRVIELPVPMTHRITKRDFWGFKHRGKQLCDIFLALWREVRSR
ncbi:MAG: glycosyltransferase family 2 protein [Firmicutes bacterium]|nr:glycosyltransferase family 2 protein [Bacillota bacterium]